MIVLYNNETQVSIGEIGEEDLAFLTSHLEEESTEDRDYYVAAVTLDIMEKSAGAPELVRVLRGAMGSADGLEIRWERE